MGITSILVNLGSLLHNDCNLYNILSNDIKAGSPYETWAGGTDGGIVNGIKGWKWFLTKTKLWDKKQPLQSVWE